MIKRIVAVVAVFIAFAGTVFLVSSKSDNVETADRIYDAAEINGGIGEKIIGDAEEAKVVVYEYADYGCAHCAEWNRKMNNLLVKYDGQLAVVFRSYNLGFNNGLLAAQAATAAQQQGYFQEYKDLLFNNQAEWIYAEDEVLDIFVSYFELASAGKGDTQRFREDLNSENVRKRNNFENRLGNKIDIRGTPTFRIDGKTVSLDKLIETIENKLK